LTPPAPTLDAVRTGGKAGVARAFAALEAAPYDEATLALLDAARTGARGAVVGLTGPPGVGKSTLAAALIEAARRCHRTVGVIVIDPSSRRTGGAILGDRTQLQLDPEDAGIFVRSMAARSRMGGVADLCPAGTCLLRALFDLVLIETVGVGQSETDIGDLVDTVVLAIQPGSGDSLQYLKSGIAEIPDIAVVTKADLGAIAERAVLEAGAALRLGGRLEAPVHLLAAATGQGVLGLLDAIDEHGRRLAQSGELARRRERQGLSWIRRTLMDEVGRRGLARLEAAPSGIAPRSGISPFRHLAALLRDLEQP
jgi:LAO/AO transport system kinase